MTITRGQLADLQPGDVVRCTDPAYPGLFTEGPLADDGGVLRLGATAFRCDDGSVGYAVKGWDLTVVSRAPRRLYVNHPRTKPVPGDVARDAGSEDHGRVWVYGSDTRKQFWRWSEYPSEYAGPLSTVRLRLLVDGETGQVVPW
jgi:hypothetical protein